jgi:hypothetical protein
MEIPDVANPEFRRHEPDRALAGLRRECPVARQPGGRFWTVAGHDDIVSPFTTIVLGSGETASCTPDGDIVITLE